MLRAGAGASMGGSGLGGRRFLMSGAWGGRPREIAVRPLVAQPAVLASVLLATAPLHRKPTGNRSLNP